MKARVRWQGGMSFLAESGSGHTVLMEGRRRLAAKTRGRGQWKWS